MRINDVIVEKQQTDLERYRQWVVNTLKSTHYSEILNRAQSALDPIQVLSIKPIGSVTSSARFTEESDIDIGIWVDDPVRPKGVSEELSWQVQDAFVAHPIDHMGVLNTVVFVE